MAHSVVLLPFSQNLFEHSEKWMNKKCAWKMICPLLLANSQTKLHGKNFLHNFISSLFDYIFFVCSQKRCVVMSCVDCSCKKKNIVNLRKFKKFHMQLQKITAWKEDENEVRTRTATTKYSLNFNLIFQLFRGMQNWSNFWGKFIKWMSVYMYS